MIINGWAIAYLILCIIRLCVACGFIGKGKKLAKLTTYESCGRALMFRNVIDATIIAGALGAYA